jgi:hypothetical protein
MLRWRVIILSFVYPHGYVFLLIRLNISCFLLLLIYITTVPCNHLTPGLVDGMVILWWDTPWCCHQLYHMVVLPLLRLLIHESSCHYSAPYQAHRLTDIYKLYDSLHKLCSYDIYVVLLSCWLHLSLFSIHPLFAFTVVLHYDPHYYCHTWYSSIFLFFLCSHCSVWLCMYCFLNLPPGSCNVYVCINS